MRWLSDPFPLALTIICLMASPHLLRWVMPPQWRLRRRVIWKWQLRAIQMSLVLLVLYSLAFLPMTARVGAKVLTGFLPADRGQAADAIVVLGRGAEFNPSRINVVTDLWQQDRAPLIFASGYGDAPVMGRLLQKAGIPATAIEGEPCSRTTYENALVTSALLRPQGIQKIILVTDGPHMWRSLLTFRSFGFQVIPQPSPIPSKLSQKRKQVLVYRELTGLIGYGLMGRYFAQKPAMDHNLKIAVPDSRNAPPRPTPLHQAQFS